MSSLDYFFLISLGVGFVYGLMKGAFRLLATLAGLVLGIYFARMFFRPVSSLFVYMFHVPDKIAGPLAFFILFVLVVVALFLLGKMLTRVSKVIALSWLNRLAGALLGVFQVALLLGLFINLYASAYSKVIGKESSGVKSLLYAPLKELPGVVFPYVDLERWGKPEAKKME